MARWSGQLDLPCLSCRLSQRSEVAIPIDFDLKTIEVFDVVAKSGGMTEAARRLNISQSAVSQAIANLERSLGAILFDRNIRPLALTPAGQLLLTRGEHLLREARELAQQVRQLDKNAVPSLRIGMVDSIAATVGPHLVRMMHAEAIHWSIWSGLAQPQAHSLIAREVDLIVSLDPLEEYADLERYEVLDEPYILALPETFSGPISSLTDVAPILPLIRFSARSMTGREVERYLRRLRLNASGQMEFDTSDAVLSMVAAGIGWAICTPLCALQARTYASSIRFEPLPRPGLRRRILLVTHSKELAAIPSRIAKAIRTILEKRCKPDVASISEWMATAMQIRGEQDH